MSPRLVIKDADGKRTIALGDAVVTIGRTAGNTIPIKETASSRTHCQVSRKPDGWYVQDLGSRNGTQVNKQNVSEHRLTDGDVIQIGKTRLVFMTGAVTASEPSIRPFADDAPKAPIKLADDDPATERFDRSRLDETEPAAPVRLPGVAEAHALVHFAGAVEHVYPITGVLTTLGRADANDIAIKGPDATSCSGKHAELRLTDGKFILADLGSTNGTKVNGIAITKHALKPGDIVELGRAQFLFKSESMGAASLDELRTQALSDVAVPARTDTAGEPAARGSVLAFLLPFALTLGGFAGAVGGLAYYAASQTRQPPPSVPKIEGNLIAEYSFEDVAGDKPVGWSATGDGATAVTVPDAPTGKLALALTQADPGSGAVPWLAVRYDRRLEVKPGQGYRLAGQVRHAKGTGRACLRMRWLNTKDPEYQRDEYTRLLASAPDWVKVADDFVAPEGADTLEVACVAVGATDAALFDSIVLRPSDAGAVPPPSIDSAEGRIVLDRAGQASAWLGRTEPIFGSLRVRVLSDAGQLLYDQPHLELQAPVAAQDGALVFAGTLPPLRGSESLPVDIAIRRAPDGFTLAFALRRGPRGGTFHVRAQTGRLDAKGPVLVESAGELKAVRGAFTRPEVTLVRWTSPSRAIGVYPEKPCYARFDTEPPGLELFAPVSDAGETVIALRLRLNFSQDAAAMTAAFKAAAAARKADRPGEAYRLYQEIQRTWPFLEGSADATAQLALLERDATAELAQLQTDLDRARFFERVGLFDDVFRSIERFTQRHAGYPQALERAAELRSRLADLHEAARAAERDETAARLLRQAADFAEVGMQGLAAMQYRRLLTLYPQSKEAEQARAALESLGKER